MTHRNLTVTGLILGLILVSTGGAQAAPPALDTGNADARPQSSQRPLVWESPAGWRQTFGKEKGNILIGAEGVEFRPLRGRSLKWRLPDIQTFFVSAHRLVIKTYKDRRHHLPGERRYRFDVVQAIPPETASVIARSLGRPSQNADPDPKVPAAETIPAHHRTRTGGTNGTLRVRTGEIDYVTSVPGDSRSWRWADLETLSKPDPYHFFVFGYRDTYTFDLKEPLARALFDRLTDEIYLHSSAGPGHRLDTETPLSGEIRGQGVGDE